MLAVINELAKRNKRLEVRFVCDRAFEPQSRGLMEYADVPVKVTVIASGKLRRYAHLSFWQHFTVPGLVIKNIWDVFKVAGGFVQSMWLIFTYRPDVVFAKGGYVCLPLGLAAHLLGIPLVIHDSDTRPGLTNKILSRWATTVATGAPLENYQYPAQKSIYTGVPISPDFHPYTSEQQRQAKKALGFDAKTPLVVATGGGLGAKSINMAMANGAAKLTKAGVGVYHIAGRGNYDEMAALVPDSPLYQLVPFVYKDMAAVLGAADVIVARGSATFLQEMAGMKKPVIIVPAKQLSDQVKNAVVYSKSKAAVVLQDDELADNPRRLAKEIIDLVDSEDRRVALGRALHTFAKPRAAEDLAKLILRAGK